MEKSANELPDLKYGREIPGDTSKNGLITGKFRPKEVPFLGFQFTIYKGITSPPVELYESVGKSVVEVFKRTFS